MASHESRAFNRQFQTGETSGKRIKPWREIRQDDNFGGDFNSALKAWNDIKDDTSVNNSSYWRFLPETEQKQYVDCLQRCENSHGAFIDAGNAKDIKHTKDVQEEHRREKEQFIKDSKELTRLHVQIKTKLEIELNKTMQSFNDIKKKIEQIEQIEYYDNQQKNYLANFYRLDRRREKRIEEILAKCKNKAEEAEEIKKQIEAWQAKYDDVQSHEFNSQQQDLPSLVKQYKIQIHNIQEECFELHHKLKNNIDIN